MSLGVRFLVLRYLVQTSVETIRKLIKLFHQEIFGFIHLLANAGGLAVIFFWGEMAGSDGLYKFPFQVHDLGDLLFELVLEIA